MVSMEDNLSQATIPTFHKRKESKTTHRKSEMANAKHASLVGLKRGRRAENVHKRSRRNIKETLKVQEMDRATTVGAGDEDDEKAEVEGKIVALQRIIPGGESFGVDELFEETADYIMALQCQIKAMRVLSGFLEGLEKEKRKCGG
uniref:BHLH domain-containing protein n=1 Tax=Salix viminalis TaxID=40686 RepID=A0A6N2KNB8_SALVM